MKVVGLVSGGKDSCFNMMECLAQGHCIVALANLRPQATANRSDSADGGELDSYMYQTVGGELVELLAQSMELPLVRRDICGRPVNQSMDYEQTADDEVEDLYQLLAEVMRQVPDVEAVSSGAILSSYQRGRVEHVCGRLGLVSLAYLWRAPQHDLLQRMLDQRLHAVLVKVACMGLHGRHLTQSLAELQPVLHQLHLKFGASVCGEGGEFESFVLDSPMARRPIRVTQWRTVVHSDDAFAPVLYSVAVDHTLGPEKPAEQCPLYHLNRRRLQQQQQSSSSIPASTPSQQPLAASARPPAAAPFSMVMREDNHVSGESAAGDADSLTTAHEDLLHRQPEVSQSVCRLWDYRVDVDANEHGQLERAVEATLNRLVATSQRAGFSDVVYVYVWLRSMADYPSINAAYRRVFQQRKLTPARACVAVDQSSVPRARFDALAVRSPGDTCAPAAPLSGSGRAAAASVSPPERRCLHVQSVSHWAPACIGPYAQAQEIMPPATRAVEEEDEEEGEQGGGARAGHRRQTVCPDHLRRAFGWTNWPDSRLNGVTRIAR